MSSTYSAPVIRAAIKQLLQGERGAVRVLPSGAFGYGAFDGQAPAATHALVLQDHVYRHRFDVVLASLRSHRSTPLSSKASHRTGELEVTVDIWTRLESTVQDDARDRQRQLVEQDAELAIQALCYPGNLTTNLAGASTGIVSGLLLGRGSAWPAYEVVSEDWRQQIHRARISAAAIVVIGQSIN